MYNAPTGQDMESTFVGELSFRVPSIVTGIGSMQLVHHMTSQLKVGKAEKELE